MPFYFVYQRDSIERGVQFHVYPRPSDSRSIIYTGIIRHGRAIFILDLMWLRLWDLSFHLTRLPPLLESSDRPSDFEWKEEGIIAQFTPSIVLQEVMLFFELA